MSTMTNLVSGNSGAIFSSAEAKEKPTTTIRSFAFGGEATQGLFVLGFIGGFEIAVFYAEFLGELFCPHMGGLVEGFVEFAAHVIDDGGVDGQGIAGEQHQNQGNESGMVNLRDMHPPRLL